MDRNENKKKRLDVALVDLGLVVDLKSAQAQIMSGNVVVDDQRVEKSGHMVKGTQKVRLKREISRFVSRGGDKLDNAFEDLKIRTTLQDAIVLDVGSSTGGFTDASLQAGAACVYSVDVGTNQLDQRLRNRDDVHVFEKTDIRDFVQPGGEPVNFVVGDVSFVPLARVIDGVLSAAPNQHCRFLLLVKPQFELPVDLIPSGGVITDESLQNEALEKVVEVLRSRHMVDIKTIPARPRGKAGNLEYFVMFRRDSAKLVD